MTAVNNVLLAHNQGDNGMNHAFGLVFGMVIASWLATSLPATTLPVVSSGELLIQLDANEPGTLTLDGSNRVSEWDDQAATDSFSLGGSCTNANLVQQPVWVPNAINGIAPAVRFDGTGTSTNFLRATSGNTSTLALTLFWVVQGAPGVMNPRGLLDTGPAQASAVRFYIDNVIAVQREPQNQAKAPVTLTVGTRAGFRGPPSATPASGPSFTSFNASAFPGRGVA